MRKLILIFLFVHQFLFCFAQQKSVLPQGESSKTNADDPASFLTRIEFFNELQHYDRNGGFDVNQTTLRAIVKLGNKFTTRIDLPFVHNTLSTPDNQQQSGIGDISFRLLGYKFIEKPKSAFTASMEVSLNTAQSALLGTGKNLLIPVISYSLLLPKSKLLLSLVLQQTNSISGDESRADVNFTKLQTLVLKTWSRRFWTILAPDWYYDYTKSEFSCNLRSRATYAPTPRINIWITPSAGLFGNFPGRYQWSIDIGGRYFLMRDMNFKKNKIAPK